MKKTIQKSLLILLMMTMSYQINAQGRFKVRQDQYIQIGYEAPNNTSLTFGKASDCTDPTDCTNYNNGDYAIESSNSGLNFWRPWPTYNAGNFKLFLTNTGRFGIGMYPNPFDWTHILQVNGKILSNGVSIGSDIRLKENIKPVENALEKVLKLNAVTYNYIPGLDINKPDINLEEVDEIKRKTLENQEYGLSKEFANDVRIGYIAQDVEKILPEIVDKDDKGYLSLDYTDLIPMAIEAIKEQQKTIDKLSAELENVKALNQLIKLPNDIGIKATLFQNNPNPFDQSTVISFDIVDEFETAQIVVSDFFGTSKATHYIANTGKGEYTLVASSLPSGTYYYSLIINNVIVDTRIMFLVK